MLELINWDCNNCIFSHCECRYTGMMQQLVKKMEQLQYEYDHQYIKDDNHPFSKGHKVRAPFIISASCEFYKPIPKKELDHE